MPGPLTGEAVGVKRRHLVRPVQPPRAAFAGFRLPPEVILIAVRWYLATDCPIGIWRSCSSSVESRSTM